MKEGKEREKKKKAVFLLFFYFLWATEEIRYRDAGKTGWCSNETVGFLFAP